MPTKLSHGDDRHGAAAPSMTSHRQANSSTHAACAFVHTHVETHAGAGTDLTGLAFLVLFLQMWRQKTVLTVEAVRVLVG